MELHEASLHYGIPEGELLAFAEAGELCDLCFEYFGDCEHTDYSEAAPSSPA